MNVNNLKVNYHIFENCNMKCQYCFRDKKRNFLTKINWKEIIDLLFQKGIRRINIAGGEPLIYSNILELLTYCKQKMEFVSIITNGIIFKNNHQLIKKVVRCVDLIGISVDSLDEKINKKIGRITNANETLDLETLKLINLTAIENNTKFKINTVVSSFNLNDRSLESLKFLKIDRYKILENDQDNTININEFNNYCEFIKNITDAEIIIERNGDMKSTYLKITSEYVVTVSDEKEYDLRINSMSDILKEIDSNKYNERYNKLEKI